MLVLSIGHTADYSFRFEGINSHIFRNVRKPDSYSPMSLKHGNEIRCNTCEILKTCIIAVLKVVAGSNIFIHPVFSFPVLKNKVFGICVSHGGEYETSVNFF
jgi:hypothetical protein